MSITHPVICMPLLGFTTSEQLNDEQNCTGLSQFFNSELSNTLITSNKPVLT